MISNQKSKIKNQRESECCQFVAVNVNFTATAVVCSDNPAFIFSIHLCLNDAANTGFRLCRSFV